MDQNKLSYLTIHLLCSKEDGEHAIKSSNKYLTFFYLNFFYNFLKND